MAVFTPAQIVMKAPSFYPWSCKIDEAEPGYSCRLWWVSLHIAFGSGSTDMLQPMLGKGASYHNANTTAQAYLFTEYLP